MLLCLSWLLVVILFCSAVRSEDKQIKASEVVHWFCLHASVISCTACRWLGASAVRSEDKQMKQLNCTLLKLNGWLLIVPCGCWWFCACSVWSEGKQSCVWHFLPRTSATCLLGPPLSCILRPPCSAVACCRMMLPMTVHATSEMNHKRCFDSHGPPAGPHDASHDGSLQRVRHLHVQGGCAWSNLVRWG